MKRLLLFALSVYALAIVQVSCRNDDEEEIVEPADLNATNQDFLNFANWTLVTKTNGSTSGLGAAHSANDPTAFRWIYIKDNKTRKADGTFPVGTILVKEFRNADGTLKTTNPVAMVKRAKGFNAQAGDWEWFTLDRTTGNIGKNASTGAELRGANLGNGSCNNCHNGAKDKDFVFSR